MSSQRGASIIIGVLALLALLAVTNPRQTLAEEFDELTFSATDAVKQLFPTGSVVGVGKESESGVTYYEVVVREGTRRIEVEVTPDGAIGAIETAVALADVPPAALGEITAATAGAEIFQVTRHEVRGTAQGGTFVPIDPPVILYEVEYRSDGARMEFRVSADGSPAPFEDDDDTPEEDDD